MCLPIPSSLLCCRQLHASTMIRNVVRTLGRAGATSLKTAQHSQAPPSVSRGLRGAVLEVATGRGPSSPGKGLRSFSETAPGDGVRTAQHAWEKSCYFNIDYKIDENATVHDAISRMSAYNVGCLIVTKNGVVSGIISERDYVCKVSLLGRQSKDTKVKEICTQGQKMIVAKRSDTLETCVEKMITAGIRHLPVIDDDTGELFGLISVKDLVKEYIKDRDDLICKMLGLPISS